MRKVTGLNPTRAETGKLPIHQAVNGNLIILGEGYRWRKERLGHRLSYAIAQDMMRF